MSDYYILDGHEVRPRDDLIEWAQWMENNKTNRHVADETIDGVRVSTVFLGLDHQWGDGPPLLFETMVFGGKLDSEQERYSTWDEAAAGHQEMLRRVREQT